MLERTHERFRTTIWARIRALKSEDGLQRREALESLIELYWPPVYAFLRRTGHSRDAAAELTQAFFSDVVLGRELFERATEGQGRMRTLILRALRNFCIDQNRRESTYRSVVSQPLAVEHEEATINSISENDGDTAFSKRWALSLFQESLRRCEEHFRSTGRDTHWELFEQRVMRPAMSGNAPQPYTASDAADSFDTPALAAAAVQTVKRRFSALLREVVSETVENPADVESELADVRRLLGRS